MYLLSINIKNLCKTKVVWVFNFGEVETRVLKNLNINIRNIFVFGDKLVPLNNGYLKRKITDIAKREKKKRARLNPCKIEVCYGCTHGFRWKHSI